jgi:simple sugar transport system permease protein
MTGAVLPAWAEYGLLPLVNLGAALVVSGLVILAIGEDPLHALGILVDGAVGYPEAVGYTLFYATGFIFTGLAVALPFHAGLFNIGGEGQAYLGGLGLALVCLNLADLPAAALLPLAALAAMFFGAAWALVPAVLQAWRGSHIVITTIMFNFIAAALMTYLLVELMIAPGQAAPESLPFDASAWLPRFSAVVPALGAAPLNLAFPLALLCCYAFWVFLWRTRWGYAIRAAGLNETAARYGGISIAATILLSMGLGGAFAGLMAVNEIMGGQHRLLLNFTAGAGFVGIAVALMGRNHPLGIVLAALLFGALYQGGAELAFEMPTVRRELIVVIEGLVILFCGALEHLFRAPLERLFRA